MIVHRFMCNLEYQRLMKGKLMKNTVVHAQLGSKSESVGFCFFTEAPEVAIHWRKRHTDALLVDDLRPHYLLPDKG